MGTDWDGKERRTGSPSHYLRIRYRLAATFDRLAEERILLAVAFLSVFIILGVLAVGISLDKKRDEATQNLIRKMDLRVTCIADSFLSPNRESSRINLARCLED